MPSGHTTPLVQVVGSGHNDCTATHSPLGHINGSEGGHVFFDGQRTKLSAQLPSGQRVSPAPQAENAWHEARVAAHEPSGHLT